jgi:ribosome-associated protein
LTIKETALLAAGILDDRKAQDIAVLEVIDLTVLADYFIIATGTSTTHVGALADEVEFKLKEKGVLPHHIEGHRAGGWVLMDYRDVIVHVFTKEAREFYSLERLWGDAERIER